MEVGYAMALNKPLLLITQNHSAIPFDIKDKRAIQYDRQSLSLTLYEPLSEAFLATLEINKNQETSNDQYEIGDGQIGWKETERAVSQIVDAMKKDKFDPTLIFCVGRGGAILGGLIAGALGNKPLIAINIKYTWKDNSRVEILLFSMRIF